MHMSVITEKKINCLDLQEQHSRIKTEVLDAFEKVYDQSSFSDGPFVQEFEKQFANFCQVAYAVGVNNGTSALHLAMIALGIGPGDEVIVPANTFIATAWGVSYAGAIPVFADCTDNTWQLDPESVREKITPRTKAVVGVHLYGQPCDVDALKSLCREYGIYFVEDAAQAHGARYKGNMTGSLGEVGCFSFYPGKNLGACGEAGAITTHREMYYLRLRSLRNHGSRVRYYHDELGYNMRMSGLEAASLGVKLKYLDGWNVRRKEIACRYQQEISNPGIRLQYQPAWAESVYHLFVVTADDREGLLKHLNKHNVFPGLHYPVPCHLQKAYASLNYELGDCPNAEYLASHCLSLPMYSELEDDQVSYIVDLLNNY